MGGGATKERLRKAECETARLQSENEGLNAAAEETKQALDTMEGSLKAQAQDVKESTRDAAAMRIQLTAVKYRGEEARQHLRQIEDVELKQTKEQLDAVTSNLARSNGDLLATVRELAELKLKAVDDETKLENETESRKSMEITLSELNTEHAILEREHRAQSEALEKAQTDLEFAQVEEMKANAAEGKAQRVAQQAVRDQQKAERETLDAKAHDQSVAAELGEVRTSRDAALSRYDVVVSELRSVEKSAADWRWLGETAQQELDNLRQENVRTASQLEDLVPRRDELRQQLAETRLDLEMTEKAGQKLESQLGPMVAELETTRKELELGRSKEQELQKDAEERYKLASTASREFRAAAKETAQWRQLAQGTRRDIEGFMARKQFEVRDRLALTDDRKARFEASGGKVIGEAGQQGMGATHFRPAVDARQQAKQLEETMQLLTIQTTQLTYAHRQGLAYLQGSLLFGQT